MLTLVPVQPAALERFDIIGSGECGLGFRHGEVRKLRQEFTPSLSDQLGQIWIVVGKVEKRRGGGKLLTLEEHGRSRRQQEQCRHGAVSARTGQLMNSRPMS